MRFVRLVILSIIFFVIIITIISLFIPSHVRIARAIQINNSKEAVMEQLNDPVNWRNWYPSAQAAKFYYQNGLAKGLILDEVKHQYLVLVKVKDEEVDATYQLPQRQVPTVWQLASATGSNSVTVQWFMDFHLRWYPWEKFSSFMFERIYGPQLTQGLDNLKSVLEK